MEKVQKRWQKKHGISFVPSNEGGEAMGIAYLLRQPKWPMRRKLFGYMLLLVALLVLALVFGLIMFGHFDSEEKRTYEALSIQMEVFEKDVFTHFDRLAAAGIQLSKDTTILLESHLAQWDVAFSDLTEHGDMIAVIQEEMIESLRDKLLQERCSGIFVMLDTTVNVALPNADYSRTGLYLKQTGYDNSDESILLYRGIASIGKAHDMMPHRKWRLEFRTDLIPNYSQIAGNAALPLKAGYVFTELFTLPGTSDQVMLLVVPLIGSDGTFYGICGYEISASYFVSYHAQPTKIDHLTCLLLPGDLSTLDASAGLSCGGSNGYYRAPKGVLTAKGVGGGLSCLSGGEISYIGLTRNIVLSPNNPDFTLAVMMLKSDYDRSISRSVLQNAILWLLLLFFAVGCCLHFSRRFLSPILKALEQLKSDKRSELQSGVPEIDDLFAFLAEQDREHERTVRGLEERTLAAHTEKERLRTEFETAQTEISRLAYSRKQEVDPDDYKLFLAGIDTLTVTERKIFQFYLEGKTVKEIIAIAEIKESTLRYHNQNIYGKLGVNSLKQLLRYAALMQQEPERRECL